VSERRLEITPEPTAQERRAIELALELERSAEPRSLRAATWLDGDGPGEDG
jgi:hypothetical protein